MIGEAIKRIRLKRGFKQYEYAEIIGVTQAYLSGIEKGNKTPSYDLILKISKLERLPIAFIFWFSISEEDIDERKVEAFRILKPTIDKMIDSIY